MLLKLYVLMSSEDGSEVQVSLYPEVISVSMNNLAPCFIRVTEGI